MRACGIVLLAATAASAQITGGSLSGVVKDASGGILPGATAMLTNEAQGVKSSPVVTTEIGAFVFPNIPAGTYTLEISMPSFKMLKRSGIQVNSGSRTALGDLQLEVGGTTEVVDVTGEAPVIQATSGERSFTIATDSVENLPIANRSFTALAALAPGVTGNIDRTGGGGSRLVMMDGVSTMDTGSNSVLLQMNVESIAEVKVLVSGYQAEFGRASGAQVSAVTKSGTNRFRGSVYDVERNSDWNSIRKQTALNGDPKPVLRERDWGYSIGGPIGKPGGSNKLFFFYSHEFAPRTSGNNIVRLRVPTQLERNGDFSRTTDNNGEPFPYIRDVSLGSACTAPSGNSAAVTTGCFAADGVLGRIPADRLYPTGLAVLNWYPLPTIADPGTLNYNYESTRPEEKLTGWQPAVKVDYQPTLNLRATGKYSGWAQTNKVINGSVPGFNDSKQYKPVVFTAAGTVNYTINPSTFFEATYGHSQNELTGCGLAQGGTGPSFCANGIPWNPNSNRNIAGFGDLPFLFPDAQVLDTRYYAFEVVDSMNPAMWDGRQMLMPPTFNWGNRISNAPPNMPFPGFLNKNYTQDFSASLTKVTGRHTLKGGFYNSFAYKAQQTGGWNGTLNFGNDNNNPIDSGFGYANAALGTLASYAQRNRYVEHTYNYVNREGYIQDNWKVSTRMTLDYGMRIVHQQPSHDKLQQGSNFLYEKWDPGLAPVLYVAGCANGAATCTGSNRSAKDPRTGALLGPNTSLSIGALVPGTGDTLNGLYQPGQGIVKEGYIWPSIVLAPRFGAAYDVTGNQSLVLRGGGGLFYDRPSAGGCGVCSNPPSSRNVTVRYGQLQTMGTSGLTTETAPSLSAIQYESGLPTSFQWNGGVQILLPGSTSLDVAYTGQHSYNGRQGIDINAVDFGSAFLPQYQDQTLAANATPGARAIATDLMRFYQGYSGISRTTAIGVRTYHSIQLSFQRRFQNGLSFGFNDTIGLYDRGSADPRVEHTATGWQLRADQAEADKLLGDQNPIAHLLKANFVWDMPDLTGTSGVMNAVAAVINDWQLSGIWTASTGSAYTAGFSYQNGGGSINLTGSPDYPARIQIVGDTGSGCNPSDELQQFQTAAFNGPLTNSVGLESGNGYLRGCFQSVLDLAIARNIRLGGGRNLQIRVDMFNAPNSAIIDGRATTLQLTTPTDPVTNRQPVFDPTTGLPNDGKNLLPNGSVSPDRVTPRNAGFGVANSWQQARSVQLQVRFAF